MSVFVSASADVADSAVVGPGSRIWHLAQMSTSTVWMNGWIAFRAY